MKKAFVVFYFCSIYFALLVPASQGKDWALTTPHFQIHSTFKKKNSKEFSRAMEDFAIQLEQIYGIQPKQPLTIYLFANHKEFFEFVKQRGASEVKYAGGFFNPGENLIAIFWQASEPATLATLFHEITHAYTELAFGGLSKTARLPQASCLPQAVNEGLSAFFESSRLRFHKVNIGLIHRGYLKLFLAMADSKSIDPIPTFLDIKGYGLGSMHESFGENQYAESWALVYYCLRGPEEVQAKFQEYLQGLRVKSDSSGLTFQSLLMLNESEFQEKWIAFLRNLDPDKQDRKNKNLHF